MKIYPVFLGRQGCPNRCLFCAQEHSTRPLATLASDLLRRRLDEMLPAAGEGEIAFYGGSFTLLPEPLQADCLAIARSLVEAGRAAGIRLSTRPDGLGDSILRRLSRMKVTTIEIGCQSFCQEVLDAARRGHSEAESRAAIQRCREAGFQVGVQLMPGLPGGDPDEARNSLETAVRQRPDFFRIYPTLVLADTGLAELWRTGQYRPWPLELAIDVCADLLLSCRRHGIPVIRLGLQQEPALDRAVLAGPHHPAFGQRVRSRLWRRMLAGLPAETGEIRVNPAEFSDAVGQGGENRCWLKKHRPSLELHPDPQVRRGQLQAGSQFWSLDEMTDREVSHGH